MTPQMLAHYSITDNDKVRNLRYQLPNWWQQMIDNHVINPEPISYLQFQHAFEKVQTHTLKSMIQYPTQSKSGMQIMKENIILFT